MTLRELIHIARGTTLDDIIGGVCLFLMLGIALFSLATCGGPV